MKRILLVATTVLIFAGCNLPIEVQRSVIVTGYDLREFASKGFLFTPDVYRGSYESLGRVAVKLIPDVRLARYDSASSRRLIDSSKYTKVAWDYRGDWFVENTSSLDALREAYRVANGLGANALMSLQVDSTFVIDGGDSRFVFNIYFVEGFAIKRTSQP